MGTPKGGRYRDVPMSESVRDALRGHRHLRGPLVFCNEDGTMLMDNDIRKPVPAAARKAGLRHLQLHVLRHTFASHLAMRGEPIKVVQELMGHTSIEVTMRYAHLAPAMHQRAVASLDEAPPVGLDGSNDNLRTMGLERRS